MYIQTHPGCLQVKQPHSGKVFCLMLFRHLLLSSNAQSSMMQWSSKFELHLYLTVMVDMLIIFRWMMNISFKYTFVTDDTFIIYKLFTVICIIQVWIVFTHRNSSVNDEYTTCQILKCDLLPTYQYAITFPLMSPYFPLTFPSLSPN